jgi:hypothetical protein
VDAAHYQDVYNLKYGHVMDSPLFLTVLSFDDKSDIIGDWQQKMSLESLRQGCCAVWYVLIIYMSRICVVWMQVKHHSICYKMIVY